MQNYIVTFTDGTIWQKAFMKMDDIVHSSSFVQIIKDDKIYMVNKNTIKTVVSESGL